MLIAQIEPPHTTRGGDWYYRTYSPGAAMAEHDGISVIDLTSVHRRRDELLREADVVVLNMVCDADLLPLVAERNRRAKVTVYDVNDDVSSMQPWNPTAGFYANPDNQILFRMLIEACSAAQFCTPELQRIYGSHHARGAVFRNQIARTPDAKIPRTDSRVVIGWGGSIGHKDDIAHVSLPLIDFISTRDDVVLHLMCDARIAKIFDRLSPDKKKIFETGGIERYYAFVAGLDVGLAPLEDTGFNRCRSDVKFLEYAMHGVVPVVQALAPYLDTVQSENTGLFFRTPEEMISLLERLVSDGHRRAEIASSATHYVRENRSERTHSNARLEFYQSLLAKTAPTSHALPRTFAELEGALVEGRHITLNSTRYELLVHDALVTGQLQGNKKKAREMLEQAARLEPSAYQPHLFGSAMSERPLEQLTQCLSKNPKSIQAHLALAERLSEAGQVKDAVSSLLAAAEIHPSYDLPYLRVAELLQKCGQRTEAQDFFAIAARLRLPFVSSSRAA